MGYGSFGSEGPTIPIKLTNLYRVPRKTAPPGTLQGSTGLTHLGIFGGILGQVISGCFQSKAINNIKTVTIIGLLLITEVMIPVCVCV